MTPITKPWSLSLLVLCSTCYADLQPINDSDLSNMTGQSAIKIDEIPVDLNNLTGIRPDGSDRDQGFTRITIGADIELNASIDRTVIGKRPRPASEVEMPELEADVILNNLRLGQVSNNNGNPLLETFDIRDPYIEIARNSDNELTGVRLGFKEASGIIGHDIIALSGDITTLAEIDSIGIGNLGLPIGAFNLSEYPYNHSSRTNRISTELGLLGALSPTLTLHLGELGHTELSGTQNLYLGFQSEEINYPKVGAGPQGTAKPGFWLNLQDGYRAPDLDIALDSSPTASGLDLVSRNAQINNSFTPYF